MVEGLIGHCGQIKTFYNKVTATSMAVFALQVDLRLLRPRYNQAASGLSLSNWLLAYESTFCTENKKISHEFHELTRNFIREIRGRNLPQFVQVTSI